MRNIVKISPIVFKRKQATLNMLLHNKTTENMKNISTKKQSNNITKKTVNIKKKTETKIPRILISTKSDSIVLLVKYKQQQYNKESSKTTTINSDKYRNSNKINK